MRCIHDRRPSSRLLFFILTKIRHQRGASTTEEDRQERFSSNYYQVRHPRGAPTEEDRQECSSSKYYQVRHPRGAPTEEDRQERSSSNYYQDRHPWGAPMEEDRQRRILHKTIKLRPRNTFPIRRSSDTDTLLLNMVNTITR